MGRRRPSAPGWASHFPLGGASEGRKIRHRGGYKKKAAKFIAQDSPLQKLHVQFRGKRSSIRWRALELMWPGRTLKWIYGYFWQFVKGVAAISFSACFTPKAASSMVSHFNRNRRAPPTNSRALAECETPIRWWKFVNFFKSVECTLSEVRTDSEGARDSEQSNEESVADGWREFPGIF